MYFPSALVTIALSLYLCLSAEFTFAKCTNPSVRKEWRSMSKAERTSWISAVKCLANLPHTDALTPYVKPGDINAVNASGSYYDDFVYMHMDMNHLIHFTGLFFPWHRWYVYVYETALKSKCGFTGASPYWDWAKDAPHFADTAFFKDSDPESGLGGFGDPAKDISVLDGGFAESSSFRLSYPSYHSLRRNLTLDPYVPIPGFDINLSLDANATFTQAEVDKMVNGFVGNFTAFQKYMEAFQGAHGAVHFIVGGDLAGGCPQNAPAGCVPGSPTYSANEPLFWMHHAMVDKVWFDWQNKHPANARAYAGGSVQAFENETIYNQYPNGAPPYLTPDYVMPGEGMFEEASIADVLSTTDGVLCYVYE